MKKFIILFFIFILPIIGISQNITITDDDAYIPHASAMLDVKSLTKGMLVPRVTSAQRLAIASPANGLLVFDTDLLSFYFHNSKGWVNLSAGNSDSVWVRNSSTVYLMDTDLKVGIGTVNPSGKFEIREDNSSASGDPLFEIKDKAGIPVFSVYTDGVIVSIDESAKGNIGGFAVSGRTNTKATNNYFYVTPDSTRVYVNKSAKGNIGGFAVSGRTNTKDVLENMFVTTPDSTRVYVDQSAKGNIGGFAVSGRTNTKSTVTNFMDLTPDNYFIGHESGQLTTSGLYNSFFGYQSGKSNVYGSNNVFLGYKTGFKNTGSLDTNLGVRNVFLGYQAGYNNTLGSDNVLLGYKAGYNVTTAGNNISIGSNAGYLNNTASDNIFIGREAGYNHINSNVYPANYNIYMGFQAGRGSALGDSASNNLFIGYRAGYSVKSGGNNVFLGNNAGYSNNIATQNVFIGNNAGRANTSGEGNVFIGDYAGESNVSGGYNVFIGRQTGDKLVNGSTNVFIGDFAGHEITSGAANSFIGSDAGRYALSGSNNVFMGVETGLWHNGGDDNVYLGNQAGAGMESYTGINQRNVILGANAGTYLNNAIDNIFIGHKAGEGLTGTPVTGDYNVIIGEQSGTRLSTGQKNVFLGNLTGNSNTEGSNNIFIGVEAGRDNDKANNNIFLGNLAGYNHIYGNKSNYYKSDYNIYIGHKAGYGSASGDSSNLNIFIGNEAGYSIKSGSDNIFIGDGAGYSNTQSHWNVYMGLSAGRGCTGGENVFIGGATGGYADGSMNCYIGAFSGRGLPANPNQGSNNTFVGYQSGISNTTGSSNVFLGMSAGENNAGGNSNVYLGTNTGNSNAGSGNVFLGHNVASTLSGLNNRLYIDNSNVSNPLIYGEFDNEIVKINGTFTFNAGTNSVTLPISRGTNGYVLTTNGSGNTNWTSTANLDNDWTVSGNNMYSAVSDYVGIGITNPTYKLHVNRPANDYGPNKTAIYGYRVGSNVSTNGGTGYSNTGIDAAIKGYNLWGNEYSMAVVGYNDNDYTRCGGAIGANTSGTYWGALGYKNSASATYGGYFTSQTTGTGKTNISDGVGIGAYGSLFASWFRGDVYGTALKGERFSLYIDGKSYTNDVIAQLNEDGSQERFATYVPTSMSVDVYIKGIAQLVNGEASIKFDEKYLSIISNLDPIIVTVTPMGKSNGIYLKETRSDGFSVEENDDGKSNVQFTWIAIATRKGCENPENPVEVLNPDFDKNLNKVMFNENDTDNSAQPIWWDGNKLNFTPVPIKTIPKKNE